MLLLCVSFSEAKRKEDFTAQNCCNKKPKQTASRLNAKLQGHLKLDATGKLDTNLNSAAVAWLGSKHGLRCHLALATCHSSRLEITGTKFKAIASYIKPPGRNNPQGVHNKHYREYSIDKCLPVGTAAISISKRRFAM